MDRSSARGRGATGGLLFAMSSRCRAFRWVALMARPIATDSSHRSVPNAQLPAKLPIPDLNYSSSWSPRHQSARATCVSRILQSPYSEARIFAPRHRPDGSSKHVRNPITVTARKRRKEGVCARNCARISRSSRCGMTCRALRRTAPNDRPLRPSASLKWWSWISAMEPTPHLG